MRNRPSVLTWIIAFKAVKTTILAAVGVGLLTVRHADPVDVLLRLALAFHLPLTSRLLTRLLSSVSNLTLPKETALAMTAFAYAILMGSEGVSLYVRKSWARCFTIIATSSLIPIELYEIAREMHPIRVLVLLANIAIVVYLCRRKDVFESQVRRTPLVRS
jgi:uncharacterized membrane protein (DUF2068 family)